MARISAELNKFNKIEVAIRDAMQGLGRAEQQIDVALAGKRTTKEKSGLIKLKKDIAAEKKRVQVLWESIFEVAEG